jgi:serine protease Do
MINHSYPKLFLSSPISFRSSLSLLLAISTAALLSINFVHAQSTEDLQSLIRASKTRAALVQNVKQAVVHIKVEKEIANTGRNTPSNPRDLKNDEFFERFFPGMQPPRGRGNDRFRQEGMGSGSIVRPDGYILTNHHVVGEADKIMVQLFDGKELEAKLIGTDPESDISVIKVEGEGMPVLAMGDSTDILVGESVIAVGNPFGLTQTVTFGIVSAKGRTGIGITEYEDFIQTDAAINPGNSGGPLINLEGKIVGVNTAIFTRSGGYQGIGFAVPINMARRIMNDLINAGRVSRGWLGVGIQDITPELAKAFRLKDTKGTLITGVMRGTPAEKAGLQKGDVVLKLNGEIVENSNALRNEIADARADALVELELVRDGTSMRRMVTLDERPKQPARIAIPQEPPTPTPQLGFSAQELNLEMAERLGYEQVQGGIVITEVEPDSAASQAGLRAGMLIIEMDRQNIDNLADFQRVGSELSLQDGILLLVRTQQGSQYIFLQGD